MWPLARSSMKARDSPDRVGSEFRKSRRMRVSIAWLGFVSYGRGTVDCLFDVIVQSYDRKIVEAAA